MSEFRTSSVIGLSTLRARLEAGPDTGSGAPDNKRAQYLSKYVSGTDGEKKRKKKKKKGSQMATVQVLDEDVGWPDKSEVPQGIASKDNNAVEDDEDDGPVVENAAEVQHELKLMNSRRQFQSQWEREGSPSRQHQVTAHASLQETRRKLDALVAETDFKGTSGPSAQDAVVHRRSSGRDADVPRRSWGNADVPRQSDGDADVPRRGPGGDADVPRRSAGDADVPRRGPGRDADVPRRSDGDADVPRRGSGRDADVPRRSAGDANVPRRGPGRDADVPRRSGGDADVPRRGSGRDADVPRRSAGDADVPRRGPGRDAYVTRRSGGDADVPRRGPGRDADVTRRCSGDADVPRRGSERDSDVPRRSGGHVYGTGGGAPVADVSTTAAVKSGRETGVPAMGSTAPHDRSSEVVYRVAGRAVSKEEFQEAQDAMKPKRQKRYLEQDVPWKDGLVQRRAAENARREEQEEGRKKFQRGFDEKADASLQQEIRMEDPMAEYFASKRMDALSAAHEEAPSAIHDEELGGSSGFSVPQRVPEHSWIRRRVQPLPNRYNIKPGRHWDGVHRSNGFEQKFVFQYQHKKAERARDEYVLAEDM